MPPIPQDYEVIEGYEKCIKRHTWEEKDIGRCDNIYSPKDWRQYNPSISYLYEENPAEFFMNTIHYIDWADKNNKGWFRQQRGTFLFELEEDLIAFKEYVNANPVSGFQFEWKFDAADSIPYLMETTHSVLIGTHISDRFLPNFWFTVVEDHIWVKSIEQSKYPGKEFGFKIRDIMTKIKCWADEQASGKWFKIDIQYTNWHKRSKNSGSAFVFELEEDAIAFGMMLQNPLGN